jgi:hypothetical protein
VNKSYTAKERLHLEMVKSLNCSVCDAPGPSSAHHIRQDNPWLCVALCQDCHQGAHNGIHGRKSIWKVMRMDEYDALAVTFRRLLE